MANRRFSAKRSRVAPAGGKSRFGLGLFLVVAGGFAGTFGALQMEGDVPEAAASVALPLRGEMPPPRGEVAPPASPDRLSARFGGDSGFETKLTPALFRAEIRLPWAV